MCAWPGFHYTARTPVANHEAPSLELHHACQYLRRGGRLAIDQNREAARKSVMMTAGRRYRLRRVTANAIKNLQVVLKQSTQKAVQSIHVTSRVAPAVQDDVSVCSHLANHGVHLRRGEREFRNFDHLSRSKGRGECDAPPRRREFAR